MIKGFCFLLLLLTTKSATAQNEENPLPYAYKEPAFDTAPQYPGGSDAMMKYFKDSIRYPEPEKTKQLQGNVLVKFRVSEKGKIINIQVINGVPGGPNLARETERVIENMPAWIPAIKNGKQVEAEYMLSVPFKLY